jgi:hypothetical protein
VQVIPDTAPVQPEVNVEIPPVIPEVIEIEEELPEFNGEGEILFSTVMVYLIAIVAGILLFVIIYCSIKTKACSKKEGAKVSLIRHPDLSTLPLRESTADLENM